MIDKPGLKRQARRDAKARELREAAAGRATENLAADHSDPMLIDEEVDEKTEAVAVETLGGAADEEVARKAAKKKATLARAQELLATLAKEDRP